MGEEAEKERLTLKVIGGGDTIEVVGVTKYFVVRRGGEKDT